MKKDLIPGIALLVLVALISNYLSTLVVTGGKHPIEASAIAIILGIAIRAFNWVPKNCESGVRTSEKLLIYGIVLLGAGLNFAQVLSQGPAILTIIAITMLVSFFLIYFSGRFVHLSETLSILLAAGTTICGTSAIAVTAPLIRSKESETSYAIATVAFFGLIAIFLYPELGHWAGASDLSFGVFAGTAIHSTPQVVGAGFIFSDAAGQMATAVKLIRNCFMAPLAIVIAIWFSKKHALSDAKEVNYMRAFPWFLFGYFLMAGLSSKGYFTKAGVDAFTEAGKFLILIGMAGVGLTTMLGAFKEVGLKPLFVGLFGSVVVAGVSAALIRCFLL